ncbi:MAG: hypothetical protein ACT4PU_09345 [Planctomycetota bacterium]
MKQRLLAMGFGVLLAIGVVAGLWPWIPAEAKPAWTKPQERPWAEVYAEQARANRADLLQRVAPKPALRPLDLVGLRAQTQVTAAEELQAMLADLQAVRERQQRGANRGSIEAGEDAAKRLALFRWRFGIDAPLAVGWEAVAAEARELLAEAAAPLPDGGEPAFRLNEESDYDAQLRALLLELAGEVDEARERLAGVQVSSWCGTCAGGRSVVLRQRRSEATLRKGEAREALALREDPSNRSLFWGDDLDVFVREAHEDVWLGVLRLAHGQAEDGVLMLQQVVDLFPATAAGEIARAALEQVGALIEPSIERLQRVYLDSFDPDAKPRQEEAYWQLQPALEALGRYGASGNSAAFERLSAEWARGEGAALRGLSALGAEAARPIFEEVLQRSDVESMTAALEGLRALPGGLLREDVETALRSLRHSERGGGSALADIDELLRSRFGDGPDLRTLDKMKSHEFGRVWLDWLLDS